MAVLQETLIWIAYAVALVVLMLVAAIFTYTYQKPRDRSASISTVTIISLTALLATILLLPVDIALVSATTSSKLGRRKDWASQAKVDNIVLTLKIIYYTLYSFDALLCLLIIPFSYFLYEEYDDVDCDDDEGHRRTTGDKILGATKYTVAFVALIIILFLVGFFVPVAAQSGDHKKDLDYFKKLLSENKPEKALTFALGILITVGTILYIIYTAAGLALFPISLIKSAPSVSAPTLAANTASELDENRERQRQLESRNTGNRDGLSSRDRRELEALARDERTLVRRQRLAADAGGEGKGTLVKIWTKTLAVLRPVKLLGGIFILLISIVLWVSILISGIDKAKNSTCKARCGYILGHSNIFNPIDWLFVKSAKVFPIDYVLVALLVFLFFSASIVGLASIGIRFLWLKIFQIRKGHTSAQALLMATVMLTLIVLAINYSLAMLVAPQYATFGPQTYCSLPPRHPGDQPNCDKHPEKILPCSELADSASAKAVCTPSVISTFLNRITLNFPYFGAVDFWGQFAFLLVFLVVFLLSLFRAPKLNVSQLDEDAEEEEEEGLLASTHRRFGATWEDITGRSKAKSTNKPTSARGSRDPPEDAVED